MAKAAKTKKRQKKKTRLSKEKVEDALRDANGNISAVARMFGCSRQAIYLYINKYEEIAEILDDAREQLVDLAEEHLVKNIESGDTTAIIFTLKTRGRNRGWGESSKLELTGANGGPIESKVAQVDPQELTPSEISERYRDVLARSKK